MRSPRSHPTAQDDEGNGSYMVEKFINYGQTQKDNCKTIPGIDLSSISSVIKGKVFNDRLQASAIIPTTRETHGGGRHAAGAPRASSASPLPP
ncbi:hypothetical protein EVAR_101778_1 [Eumeta japonica]|uniref:Uncharacterized protein n=1 Tax=Eumeta variegata TaxID=151549 RepID=A0A4C1SQC0_EUMVA|nr:hypothetical protein EVAR_101778_1 [Eumeta japonica]